MPVFKIFDIKPFAEQYNGTSFPAKVIVGIKNQVIEDVVTYTNHPNNIRQVHYNELEGHLQSIPEIYSNNLDQEIIKVCRAHI